MNKVTIKEQNQKNQSPFTHVKEDDKQPEKQQPKQEAPKHTEPKISKADKAEAERKAEFNCPDCDGEGIRDPNDHHVCQTCEGSGKA